MIYTIYSGVNFLLAALKSLLEKLEVHFCERKHTLIWTRQTGKEQDVSGK